MNKNGDICKAGSSDEAGSSESEMSDHEKVDQHTCQRSNKFQCKMPSDSGPITSTPVKSKQIIIMLSQEQPVLSDESVTIDVVNDNDNKVTNLYDIPLDEMSIEIVDDLSDPADGQEPVVYFNPLTDDDWCKAAIQFNLKIGKAHVVNINRKGNKCGNPPYIHTEAKADGSCLFNSVSILLTGSETYSAIIHHVVCNYISNPV